MRKAWGSTTLRMVFRKLRPSARAASTWPGGMPRTALRRSSQTYADITSPIAMHDRMNSLPWLLSQSVTGAGSKAGTPKYQNMMCTSMGTLRWNATYVAINPLAMGEPVRRITANRLPTTNARIQASPASARVVINPLSSQSGYSPWKMAPKSKM